MAAPTHVSAFDGHSIFCVMLHLPDGRQAAISYLDKLRSFAQSERVWVYQTNRFSWVSTNSPREVLELNPNLPQFPTNTQWALVRRMCVIDADGNIQTTPIVESIQARRYLAFTPPTTVMVTNRNGFVVPVPVPPQTFSEFQMNRRRNCELRQVAKAEKGFTTVHFMGKGIDLFESSFRNSSNEQPDSATLQSTVLKTCVECHSARGIFL